jgi:hypothetical protein
MVGRFGVTPAIPSAQLWARSQRHDAEQQAADAERRQAEHHRHRARDQTGVDEREHEAARAEPARHRVGDRGADTREGELPERELTAEAGDDAERQADQAEGDDGDQGDGSRVRREQPGDHRAHEGKRADDAPEVADGPHLAEGVGQHPPRLEHRPVLALLEAAAAPRLEEQGDDDDAEEGDLRHAARGVVDEQDLIDHPDADAGEERNGKVGHARDHGRRERAQQQHGTERLGSDEAARREDEHGRERGDGAGHGPGHGRHARRGDAGHAGPLAVCRGRLQREPEAAAAQEEHQREDHDRREQQHGGVRARHEQHADVELRKPRRLRVRAARARLAVHDGGEGKQELSDAEGRDQAHEPRRRAEAPDHDDLGARADSGGDDQRTCEREPVRQVPTDHGHAAQRGAERTDLPVGEVDDAVRAVHEHQPDGEDAVGHAGDGAEREDRGADVEPEDGDAHVRAPYRFIGWGGLT